jgi:hypothetical protein
LDRLTCAEDAVRTRRVLKVSMLGLDLSAQKVVHGELMKSGGQGVVFFKVRMSYTS